VPWLALPAEVPAVLVGRRRLALAPRCAPWDGAALLTPAEAAQFLAVPETEFRRDFIGGKRIPVVSLSVKRPRVRVQDLRDYVDSRTVGA